MSAHAVATLPQASHSRSCTRNRERALLPALADFSLGV
jgi:hypothetical protein